MPKRSTDASFPAWEMDRGGVIWYREQAEDLRLAFPAEFDYCYIDKTGEVVIVAAFKRARNYSHGRAVVCHYFMAEKNGLNVTQIIPNYVNRWKIIDTYGIGLSTREYDYMAPFIDKKVTVARNYKDSFLLSRDGEELARYKNITALFASSGRIVTENTASIERYGLMDYNGDAVTNQKFARIGEFHSGLAPAGSERFPNSKKAKDFINENYGYIDKDGELAIDDIYSIAGPFRSGYATVKKKEAWELIDTSGKTIVQGKYDWMGELDAETGLIPVRKKHQCGFINVQGEIVIKFEFAGVREFTDGLAAATKDGLNWGYIDLTGKFAIQPIFQMCFPFGDGLALVCRALGGYKPMQRPDSKNPVHLVREARDLRNQYKYDQARELFDTIIETAPGSLAAKQAEAFKRTELPTKAPQAIVDLYAAALVLANSGKDAEAEAKLLQCVEQEPDFEPAFGALASTYMRTQRVEDAKGPLLNVLKRHPNYARGLDFLKMVYSMSGDREAAQRMDKKLMEINPYFREP